MACHESLDPSTTPQGWLRASELGTLRLSKRKPRAASEDLSSPPRTWSQPNRAACRGESRSRRMVRASSPSLRLRWMRRGSLRSSRRCERSGPPSTHLRRASSASLAASLETAIPHVRDPTTHPPPAENGSSRGARRRVAEGVRFELTIHLPADIPFQAGRLRPLGHPSRLKWDSEIKYTNTLSRSSTDAEV